MALSAAYAVCNISLLWCPNPLVCIKQMGNPSLCFKQDTSVFAISCLHLQGLTSGCCSTLWANQLRNWLPCSSSSELQWLLTLRWVG